MMIFGERLLKLMKDAEVYTSEIARGTNISKARISGFLSNKFEPSFKNLISIADYFNCSIDYLVGISDTPNIGRYTDHNYIKFAENFQAMLKTHKISNRYLSQMAEINKSNLSLWKKGSFPHVETLIKISKILPISIDSLIERNKI